MLTLAKMDLRVHIVLLCLFLTVNTVTTFDISNHKEASPALSAFQRMRQVVSPEYMLHGKPLSGEDVNKWLRTSDVGHASLDSEGDAIWVSNRQHVHTDGSFAKSRDVSNNRPLELLTVIPTKDELGDVTDVDKNTIKPVYKKSVDKKEDSLLNEETSNAGSLKIIEQNKVLEPVKTVDWSSTTQDLSLDTLTKEEFKALMKAIEKLRKQSSKLSLEPVETTQVTSALTEKTENNKAQDTVLVVQPPFTDGHNPFSNNLQSPVAKEAVIFLETIPDLNNQRESNKRFALNNLANRTHLLNNIDTDVINDLASNLEDNLAEKVGHYIPGTTPSDRIIVDSENVLQGGNIKSLKRNSIRDVSLVKAAIKDILNEGVTVQKKSNRDDLSGGGDHTVLLPTRKTFVRRILELQDEADRLKMILQLEELENDVLTDALNEASMGQGEGTVSRLEFDSLKEAIQIEEAVHDLQRRKHHNHQSDDIIKLRTPLEQQKRFLGSEFSKAADLSTRNRQVTKDDLQRLLGQVYLLKDEAKKESEPEKRSSNSRTIAEQCPPMLEANTVCSWTNLDSIPEDVKAKSLCAWKDMCCGCHNRKAKTFHLGWEKCNLISEAVTSSLCQDEGSCPLNSGNSLTTKMTNSYNLPLIPSFSEEPTGFWTCRKGQQVGVWVCGYCWSTVK